MDQTTSERIDVTIEMNESTEQLVLQSLLGEFEYRLYEEGLFDAELADIIHQLIEQIGDHEAWCVYGDTRTYDFELTPDHYDVIAIAVGHRLPDAENARQLRDIMDTCTEIGDQLRIESGGVDDAS
jgi:hypothetical protein